MSSHLRLAVSMSLLVGGGFTLIAGGGACHHQCKCLQRDYRDTLQSDDVASSPDDERRAHFGIDLQIASLERWAHGALQRSIREYADRLPPVEIGGLTVAKFTLNPTRTELTLQSANEASCPRCLRASVRLGGKVGLETGIGGTLRTRLTGDIEWMAPLRLDGDPDGIQLELQTGRAIQQNGTSIVTEFEGLPEHIKSLVERALSSELADIVTSEIPSLTLYRLEAPTWMTSSVGLEPVDLTVDDDGRRIVALFRARTSLVDTPKASDLHAALARGRSRPVSWIVSPAWVRLMLMAHARSSPLDLSHGSRIDEAMRWYLRRLDWSTIDEDGLAVGLRLSGWRLPDRGRCLRFDGTASARVTIQSGTIEARLDRADIQSTSGSALALRRARTHLERFVRGRREALDISFDLRELIASNVPLEWDSLQLDVIGGFALLEVDLRELKVRRKRAPSRRARPRVPGSVPENAKTEGRAR